MDDPAVAAAGPELTVREELAPGYDVPVAVRRTLRTAGRTVVFSAATVASSLAALLVFRIAFLRSFAYAGIAVVGLAAVGAVGLSMDYEVFMLSRVKEEYDRTGDNLRSVALGLERTGRIVTAAAVLIAVVFAAFWTGRVSFMKMFGIG